MVPEEEPDGRISVGNAGNWRKIEAEMKRYRIALTPEQMREALEIQELDMMEMHQEIRNIHQPEIKRLWKEEKIMFMEMEGIVQKQQQKNGLETGIEKQMAENKVEDNKNKTPTPKLLGEAYAVFPIVKSYQYRPFPAYPIDVKYHGIANGHIFLPYRPVLPRNITAGDMGSSLGDELAKVKSLNMIEGARLKCEKCGVDLLEEHVWVCESRACGIKVCEKCTKARGCGEE